MKIILTADTLVEIAHGWVKKRFAIDGDAIEDISECGVDHNGKELPNSFAQVEVTIDDEKLRADIEPILPANACIKPAQ